MKERSLFVVAGVTFLVLAFAGCSFSAHAEFNSEGKAVLRGKSDVLVTAQQPALPPPPPPPPPKPVLKAVLVGKKIEISEKVMFDYNKATIKVDSHQLLNDVATVIKEHPEIKKIRIEGHTSSEGKAKLNKKLSQDRANAVKDFLVKLGLDANLFEAVGYGPDKPIAPNDTEENREKNRRVEFNIVDRSDAPAGEAPANN